MKDLTPGQARVMAAIRRRERLVCDATFRELMAELGIQSPNGLSCHLRPLEKKGYIKREKGRNGIEILKREAEP